MAANNVLRCIVTAFGTLATSGCGSADEDQYGIGYRDGYATGYNTACEIRATMIHGTWDDEEYSRGFADGQSAGVVACNHDREQGSL